MQSSNPPPDGLGREYRAWFGFWAELVVLGALAIAGGYFASHGGGPGDYATGLVLGMAAIALAFLRLKRRFDGAPTKWERFLLVDDTRNLWLVIAVFVALGLAGLFVAAAEQEGSLHVAGVALFATSGLIVFLSLKNVFDNLDRRSQD
jgi:hypothetical protein